MSVSAACGSCCSCCKPGARTELATLRPVRGRLGGHAKPAWSLRKIPDDRSSSPRPLTEIVAPVASLGAGRRQSYVRRSPGLLFTMRHSSRTKIAFRRRERSEPRAIESALTPSATRAEAPYPRACAASSATHRDGARPGRCFLCAPPPAGPVHPIERGVPFGILGRSSGSPRFGRRLRSVLRFSWRLPCDAIRMALSSAPPTTARAVTSTK